MDQPPSNIQDIYRTQGWNNPADINADIAAGGWRSKVGVSGGSSNNNIDLNAPIAAAQAMRGTSADLLASQNTENTNFLNKFTNTINNQGTTQALADKISGELGLPALRQNANTLNTTFANLPSTYRDATKGYNVNANQLARIIGQKGYELGPAMTTANNALGTAENVLNQQLGYAQNDWQRQLLPLNSEQAMLADRQARETSLYTQDNQNELNALLTKVSNGIALSNAEKDRAQALSIAESGYANELAKITAGQKYIPVMNLGAINTQSGQFITPTSGNSTPQTMVGSDGRTYYNVNGAWATTPNG